MRYTKAIIFLLVRTCFANDTALHEGWEGPMPVSVFQAPESVIQMVSEKIDVDFGRAESNVRCVFIFRSTKEGSDVFQLVGFPDLGAALEEAERRSKDGKQVAGPLATDSTGPFTMCKLL
jgi:hypothetical protein